MTKRKRKQITLWVLPETDEKIDRLAEEALTTRSTVVDGSIKKMKEPDHEQ